MILHSNIKLIIFDLDGTLVDSVPDIALAANRMREEMGYSKQRTEQVAQWVGNGSAMLVKRALGNAQNIEPDMVCDTDFQQGHELFFKHYRACNGNNTTLYPGVLSTLNKLKKQKIQMAIATNKPLEFTVKLLEALNINHFFNCCVGGDSLTVKKPDPAPLMYCAESCNVTIEECLMVGDSMTDVQAARNANMEAVCVSYGYNRGDNLAQETHVIHNFDELVS